MAKNFLSFLEKTLPNVSENARLLEEHFFSDVNGAMSKARLIIEEIIQSIWNLENFDSYGSNTKSLSDKIYYLYKQEILELDIYNAFNYIRKVGNDAVHLAEKIEQKKAFIVHKEIYEIAKWYFELYTMLEGDIPSYNQPSITKFGQISEELIEIKIKEMFKVLQDSKEEKLVTKEMLTVEQKDLVLDEVKEDLEMEQIVHSKNYLMEEVSKLKISSAEAVENAISFSEFKNYLHVTRPIQEKVEKILEERNKDCSSNLILLCGSVGDGKSHLLAYLKNKHPEILEQYTIFNDATESFSPSKTSLETLEELFSSFSDTSIESSNEKKIIAINLGVLNNFVNMEHENFKFNKFKEFINNSGIFTDKILTHAQEGVFDLVSFSDYQMYELTPNGAESHYFTSLFDKVCAKDEKNPFYLAYKKDLALNQRSVLHENFEFLSDPIVRENIVQILIKVMIQFKHSISSRHFLNFIADLLIPNLAQNPNRTNDIEKLKSTLPYLLFNTRDRSKLMDFISFLNPLNYRNQVIDGLLVKLNTLNNWESIIESEIVNNVSKRWLNPFAIESSEEELQEILIVQLVASMYLTNEKFSAQSKDETYDEFLKYLYAFNKNDKSKIREYFKKIRESIFNWKGSAMTDYINLYRLDNDLALAQQMKIFPKLEKIDIFEGEKIQNFKAHIKVAFTNSDKDNEVGLEVDYSLFKLLYKVEKGYRPNKKDEEDATTFIDFLEKIMDFGNKHEEVLFNFILENKKYKLSIDEIDDELFVFKKVE